MNRYQVRAVFRTNINRNDRRDLTLTVRAASKEAALFVAGFQLRLDLDLRCEGVVSESLELDVRRMPR